MKHPATSEQYAEGAKFARNNASDWLDDAECLLARSPGSHALAAAIMGCEEGSKACTWLLCSMMVHSDAVVWDSSFRRSKESHYLRMFMAIYMGGMSAYFLNNIAAVEGFVTDFFTKPLKEGFSSVARFLHSGPLSLPDMFAIIPNLPVVRAKAFYVDWIGPDNFSTPHDAAPGEAAKYIAAGRELIKLLDYLLPLGDQISPEEHDQVGLALKPLVQMITGKEPAAWQPMLTALIAGVTEEPPPA